jgi:hypothetical protein
MESIFIQVDSTNNKLIKEFALEHGAKVFDIENEDIEDFLLGQMMKKEETNELVSRDKIMELLESDS